MEISKALEYLIRDRNIPKEIFGEFLRQAIDTWNKEQSFNYEVELKQAIYKNAQRYLFLGPVFKFKTKTVKVSKIVSLNNFFRFYLKSNSYLDFDYGDISFYEDRIIRDPKFLASFDININSRFANWVSLNDETKGLNVDEMFLGLGINMHSYMMEETRFIKLVYEVPSQSLKTPTILDSLFEKTFVPKIQPLNELPRAWNWHENKWGLAEFVHPNIYNIKNVKVELIGTPTIHPIDIFKDYKIDIDVGLEDVVKEIILQIGAHKELEQYISSDKDLLSLTPFEFEEFVKLLYQRRGLIAIKTQPTRDGGFDVIVLKYKNNKKGLLIQVKKTKDIIGIRLIRELFGARVLAEDAFSRFMLVFITTSKFSQVARQIEKKRASEIELIDYIMLQQQLSSIKNIGVTDILDKAIDYKNLYGNLADN